MKRAMERFGAILVDARGAVLPIMLIFSLVVTIGGMAFLSLADGGYTMLRRPLNEIRALYLAEGVVRKAVWKLNRCSLEQWSSCGSFTDTTSIGVVDAVYDSTTNVLICTGLVDDASKTISVGVGLDLPTDHVISYTNLFTQNGTSGDVIYPEDAPPIYFGALPIVDLAFYESIADTVYTPPSGIETFNYAMSPGIHYVDGDAAVKNGTVLNGTIVATGTVRFYGGSTISAQPVPGDTLTYYPAIISAGSSLSDNMGGSPGLEINGMVYTTGTADFNPCSVNGPVLAANVSLSGVYDVTYDLKYNRRPPGFSFPVGSFRAELESWSES